MTAVGGNLENKAIGLQFGVSGTFVDCELVDGKVQLKSTGTDSAGNNIYTDTGTWTSDIIDIGDNFKEYGKLFASETKQGTSSIKLETRTSDDGAAFDEWETVASDGTIASTKRRRIQVRVTFYVAYDDVNFYISQGNNPDDAKNVFNNDFIDTSNGITLKRDYEFEMTKDTSWTGEGELHRKLITRDDWSKLNKMNVLPKEQQPVISWDSNKVNHGSTKFSNNDMTVYLYNLAQTAITNVGKTKGKWYWEITTQNTVNTLIGVATDHTTTADTGLYYAKSGQKRSANGLESYGVSYVSGDTIGIALDLDIGALEFYKNGVSQGIAFTNVLDLLGGLVYPAVTTNGGSSDNTFTLAVQKESFKYSIPNGYQPYGETIQNKSLILNKNEYKKWNKGSEGVEGVYPRANFTGYTSVEGTVSASYKRSESDAPWLALSKDNASWFADSLPSGLTSHWLKIELPKPLIFNKISVTAFNYAGGNSAITHYALYGSNDDIVYDLLLETEHISSANIKETKTFNNDKFYKYYKLDNMLGYNRSSASIGIKELEFHAIYSVESAKGWSTVSSTLPTSTQFLSDGMDSLSPLLDRRVETLEPQLMTDKSEILQVGETGKVFSKTIDLKKYMDLRSINVEVE